VNRVLWDPSNPKYISTNLRISSEQELREHTNFAIDSTGGKQMWLGRVEIQPPHGTGVGFVSEDQRF
jgi:hypothetical protein